eukprot:536093_1
MSSFPITIIAFISFITINSGQYFNCTGNYTVDTYTESPCYRQTMNCVNDCTIDCIGDRVCLHTITNGGNGNVIINCIGQNACQYMDIIAIAANGLRVNGNGYIALWSSIIDCPQNKYCNITVDGQSALQNAKITGSIGSKIMIQATGKWVMWKAHIYCPSDHTAGSKYENDGVCDIYSSGFNSLYQTNIYANEGFNNVRVICVNSNCIFEAYPPNEY